MTARAAFDNAVDAEAGLWLARRRADVISVDQEQAFQAWLSADPAHADAYARVSRTLRDIGSLDHLAALAEDEPASAIRRRNRSFRYLGMASAAAAAVVVGIVFAWPMLGHTRLDAATEVAETRNVALPDGSRITLAPKSRIRVDFTSGRREVTLAGGEAFFDVVHDPRRPFTVHADGMVVRDVGTKFDVNASDGRVRVAVLEGEVEVRQPAAGGDQVKRRLRGGEGVEAVLAPARDSAGARPAAVLDAAPSPAGAWREGRLVYDDAHLGDVVADLNRYYGPGVRLADPRLGERRLAASFKVGEMDTFLDDLPKALPVRVTRDARGQVTIAPAG